MKISRKGAKAQRKSSRSAFFAPLRLCGSIFFVRAAVGPGPATRLLEVSSHQPAPQFPRLQLLSRTNRQLCNAALSRSQSLH